MPAAEPHRPHRAAAVPSFGVYPRPGRHPGDDACREPFAARFHCGGSRRADASRSLAAGFDRIDGFE